MYPEKLFLLEDDDDDEEEDDGAGVDEDDEDDAEKALIGICCDVSMACLPASPVQYA